jgi:hypothetical protein
MEHIGRDGRRHGQFPPVPASGAQFFARPRAWVGLLRNVELHFDRTWTER